MNTAGPGVSAQLHPSGFHHRPDGSIQLGTVAETSHTIPHPPVWLGHDLKHPFHVWSHIPKCPGVFVSAAQILTKPYFNRSFREQGLRQGIGFRGPIFIDSGGFRLQRLGREEFDWSDLLTLYRDLRPDCAAVLDVPLDPQQPGTVNAGRWRQTLRNTRLMFAQGVGLNLVPVVHGYDSSTIRRRLDELLDLGIRPPFICLGSLVPLLRGVPARQVTSPRDDSIAAVRRWSAIAEVVVSVKSSRFAPILHVFGAGSLSTIFLLLLLGADSVDSTAWRVKAAFGAIQLPGRGDRFPRVPEVSSRRRRGLSNSCRDALAECACPVCEGKSLSRRVNSLGKSFYSRATHNASVVVQEVLKLKAAIARGVGAQFIEERFRDATAYRRVLADAIIPALSQHRSRI